MSDTQVQPGGSPVPQNGGRVAGDQSSITGDGTAEHPLTASGAGGVVITNSTLTGDGTAGVPLGINPGHVAVVADGTTIAGTGTTGSPLHTVGGGTAVAVDGTTITGTGVAGSPLVSHAPPANGIYDVTLYGAIGNGIVDDGPAIRTAAATANAAGGGVVYFPPGTYKIGQDGANPWCFAVPGDHLTFQGVRGSSTLIAAAGLPPSTTPFFYLNLRTNIVIADLILDGNWGAVIGVTNSQAGINQGTQADPKNHLLMIRGCTNTSVIRCDFTQSYGDMIWIGYDDGAGTQFSSGTYVTECSGDISARNGVSMGACSITRFRDCKWSNIFSIAHDTEPQGDVTPARDTVLDGCEYGLWWDTAAAGRNSNIAVTIIGSNTLACGEENAARSFRINNCVINGVLYISSAIDVSICGTRVVCDFAGLSVSPIYIDHLCQAISVDNCYVYDRTASFGGRANISAILITAYEAGILNWQPTSVKVSNSFIYGRNGKHGIAVVGTGGFAGGVGVVQAPITGVATGVSATTISDSGAAFPTLNGWLVRMGGVVGTVKSNTGTDITITGWFTPLGEATATPAIGSYVITQQSDVVVLANNTIDCGDDGNGPGLYGVFVLADRSGMRVRVKDNDLHNCTDYGVYVGANVVTTPIIFLEISGNTGFDDQATPTFSYLVNLPDPCHIGKLVMDDNITTSTFPLALTGPGPLTTLSAWLTADGAGQQWMGYGVPGVAAPDGSTFQRLDGTAGATYYVRVGGAWSGIA